MGGAEEVDEAREQLAGVTPFDYENVGEGYFGGSTGLVIDEARIDDLQKIYEVATGKKEVLSYYPRHRGEALEPGKVVVYVKNHHLPRVEAVINDVRSSSGESDVTSEAAFMMGPVGEVPDWPADFPDVVVQTTISKMKEHPAYTQAKGGSMEAAVNVVDDLVKEDKVRDLARRFPSATVVPVFAEEKIGYNKLPLAYALVLEQAGFEVEDRIVQTNQTFHTGASSLTSL
ncbi:MAG: hypothetical protein ACE5G0_11870 [Rhodothermales bacterium]